MRFSTALLVGVVFFAAAPARADVRLTIQDGQVSLDATNATVREILAEWSRVGQTKIVNGDRVPGGPLTMQLNGVTEEQALEVILRSAAGYVVAPRTAAVANASRYDRILVMPTTTPTRPAPPQPAFPQQQGFQPPPQFQPFQQPPRPPMPPQQPPPVNDADADADGNEPVPNVVLPNPGMPIFNGVRPVPQQPPPPGYARPVPGQVQTGVPVPGMVVPAPAQPGQPGVRPPDREP
jgi:hypothetical protein